MIEREQIPEYDVEVGSIQTEARHACCQACDNAMTADEIDSKTGHCFGCLMRAY